MKRKTLAMVMCLLLTLSTVLAGCGSSGATSEEPAATTAQTIAVEEKTEEPAATPVAEEEPEKEPEVVEEPTKEAEEVTEATEAPEATKETTETETPKADEPAETTQAEEVPETPEAPAEPVYTTVIDKYIADGDFTDYAAYGAEMGTTDVRASSDEWNIDFYFGNYYVSVGTNVQDPTYTYVCIGSAGGGDPTYCCLYDYTKSSNNVPVFSDGVFISAETAYGLEKTINYMKSHTDYTQKPAIDGMTWLSWDEVT